MFNFECGTCNKTFSAGWKARDQHLSSTGHHAPTFECDTCPRYFNSDQARFQHMHNANHFAYMCSICEETWPSDQSRTQHEQHDHYHCKECQRHFANYNNLKMHLTSQIHRQSQIQCPFCKRDLGSATGLTHHLERGACPNAAGLNRETLFKFVRSKDPGGAITNNLIGWHGSTHYEANHLAYNQHCQAWECYLCHRLFASISSLNQHLNSPVHQEKFYHCPKRDCRREFTTLAAIINHLESEACGCMRFKDVQQGIQGIVSGNRLIGF